MEIKTHPLAAVLSQLENLREYGHNAVLRRAINVVHDAIYKTKSDTNTLLNCRPDGSCRPDHICLVNEQLPLEDVLHESISDDRRISTFIDPRESLIYHLHGFYSGRSQVLELRTSDEESFLKLEAEAMEFIREKNMIPIVTVNVSSAKSKEEIVLALQDMVRLIQEQDFSPGIMAAECALLRYDSLGTRWINGGRTLEQGRVEILACRRRDACCGNATYTRQGKTEWTPIWNDGDSTNKPPVTPPNFSSRPWNHELELLPTPVIGTLTSDWGWRTIGVDSDFHGGIDIAVPAGTQVLSINTGQVHIVGDGYNGGVVISDGERTYTYFHITPNPILRDGQSVGPGTVLGNVASGGPIHLHYAIHHPPQGDVGQRNDANSENPLP